MAIELGGRIYKFPIAVPRIGGIHPERAVKLRQDIEISLPGRTGHVNTLGDIVSQAPFTSPAEGTASQRTLVLDIDGVVTPNSISSLRALGATIAPQITEFIPWTGRVNLGNAGKARRCRPFPFIDTHTVRKLQDFVKRANPSCDTSTAMVGFKKQLPNGKQEFIQTMLDRLGNSQQVVIVGSDNVDDERVRQVIKVAQAKGIPLDNLYYYCTDRSLMGSVFSSVRKKRR